MNVRTDDIFTQPKAHPLQPFFIGVMPMPPSVNFAYQIIKTRDGMRIGPTPDLERFKHEAALMLTQAICDWSLINAVRESKEKVPLRVLLRAYFATAWKRDLDGCLKYAIDAAFKHIELNDNLVVEIVAEKHVDALQARVEIDISCVPCRS